VAALVAYARERGADLKPVLKDFGLADADLLHPESRVELPANQALWERAAQASRDIDFGLHFAERLDLDAFQLVGHLARTSRTLGEALERVAAWSAKVHDAGRTELERTDSGEVLLFPGCRGLPSPPTRHIAEFNAASIVGLARFIIGVREWAPEEVSFEHAAPTRLVEHRRAFGVTPIFGAPETCLRLAAASLELPVRPTSPSKLGVYLEGYAKKVLARLPDVPGDVKGQVLRGVVAALPSGHFSIEELAAKQDLTPRTLWRRLADLGTSFAELVDEARLRAAERYLADDVLPLAEVSFLLGFEDVAAFQKAFRAWSGKTPGAWREDPAPSAPPPPPPRPAAAAPVPAAPRTARRKAPAASAPAPRVTRR
jgi:AraC-like DNA-binding protein